MAASGADEPAYDFAAMAESLTGAFPSGANRAWLEQSWGSPDNYRAALFERAGQILPHFTSLPGATIDAYHDLIEAHLGRGRPAYCCSRDGQSLTELSYEALHSACVALSEEWRARQVVAGQSLAILCPSGPSRLIAVLAGLRLGLVVSVVEPRGRRYVLNRLRLIAADHVAAGPDFAWYGYDQAASSLPISVASGAQSVLTMAHRYGPDDPMLRFASPLAEGEDSRCELSAMACMTRLLSDALVLLPIAAGERVAAVGRDNQLVEPTLWFATLLAGGTFVDLRLSDCQNNPALLGEANIHVMLAGAPLLDILLSQPVELTSTWKRWSVDPTGKLEWNRWWTFCERFQQGAVHTFNAVYLPQFGGCLAISPKTKRLDPLRIVPAPGVSWALHDVSGVGAPVPVDNGVLTVAGCARAQVGDLMVAGSQSAYGLAGAVRSRVDGLPYPEQEVVALVREHAAVAHAAVVVLPDREIMNHGAPCLLLFVDPFWCDDGGLGPSVCAMDCLCDEMRRRIIEELGSAACPARVEAFALSTRQSQDSVDQVWAVGQYVTGLLYKKRELPAFLAIAKLRRLFEIETRGR